MRLSAGISVSTQRKHPGFTQISWLAGSEDTSPTPPSAFPNPLPKVRRRVAHTKAASHLQWRDRAGLSPVFPECPCGHLKPQL